MAGRGVNKVILVGNIGQDPEVRYMQSGSAVANVSLATSESWKDKTTGAAQERTEWHRVVFYSRLAEIVGEYVKKGSKLYVEGSLRTRKWQDKSGADRYTTEIIADEMQMLDSKGQGNNAAMDMSSMHEMDMDQSMGNAAPRNQNQTSNRAAEIATTDFDDDIPF